MKFDFGEITNVCDISFPMCYDIFIKLDSMIKRDDITWRDIDRMELSRIEFKNGDVDLRLYLTCDKNNKQYCSRIPLGVLNEEK